MKPTQMQVTYIDQDGREANLSDAVNATIESLRALIENSTKVGGTDLFGEVTTGEGARAALQANLCNIGRSLVRIAESVKV